MADFDELKMEVSVRKIYSQAFSNKCCLSSYLVSDEASDPRLHWCPSHLERAFEAEARQQAHPLILFSAANWSLIPKGSSERAGIRRRILWRGRRERRGGEGRRGGERWRGIETDSSRRREITRNNRPKEEPRWQWVRRWRRLRRGRLRQGG